MKTRNQLFGLIAIVAIITIGIIACKDGGDDKPTEEQPVATTYDLTCGDIKITLHYKKKPSEPVPAYVDKIQNRLTSLAGNPGNATLMSGLKDRNGNYSINVIYDGTSFDEFVATDGQTIKAHNTWLIANTETITGPQLTAGLEAMLALPPLDENGVPYYGTLPNTTIKIYKGDATITDAQMTAAVTKIQTNYTNNVVATGMVDDFQGYVSSVRVVTGTEVKINGNIVAVGLDATDMTIGTAFLMIGMGYTTGW